MRTPIIHQLIKQAELSRLGYMMGALLEAGIPVTEALLSLEKASTFRQYQNYIVFFEKIWRKEYRSEKLLRDTKKHEN